MTRRAIAGVDIFDGLELHRRAALLLDGARVAGIVPETAVPAGYSLDQRPGGTLLPGFVDLQVNGGGGAMFNDETSVKGLRLLAEAHHGTGTRALLPTMITDTPERTEAAVEAVVRAIAEDVPGIIGLHLEGPHLSITRKGAHDPDLIRPMTDADEAFLIEAARRLPNLMVTLAPESVPPDRIARLTQASVIVSLGHTVCSLDSAMAAFDAGARSVTHLFNAMSQMSSREPGLVGAALDHGVVSAGLIADGIHVHPANIRAALAAKRGPGALFLVTDAMATLGSGIDSFQLNGRRVSRRDGRLTLEDGTLAGADLDMPTALRVMTGPVGLERTKALAMATSVPAALLRQPGTVGHLQIGEEASVIYLDAAGHYAGSA